jgi:predicted transcriptional regulator of viral defense system
MSESNHQAGIRLKSDNMSYSNHMPGKRYTELAELAAEQHGFVTQADADELGVPSDTLVKMADRGRLERRARGVYRFPIFPAGRYDQYMEAALWPQGVQGVLSHETALDLRGLSDVNPAKVHITVPRQHRPRREIPSLYVLHYEDLADDEHELFEDLPIVTVEKAIRQAHADHLRPDLVAQALYQAGQRALLRRTKVEELERELGIIARERT